MGWGDTMTRDGADDPEGDRSVGPAGAFAGLTTAAAVAAAQIPAVCLLWWVDAASGDDYGTTYGGAFGLLCLLVLAPVILPVLGLIHAALHIGPAGALAHLVARRLRGPEWAWHLLCAALVGVAWAALAAVLWDWPFVATSGLLVALGVLPVLGLAHVSRRARVTGKVWGTWSVWFLAALASAGLFALAIMGALLATFTGLIQDYEPPTLSSGQLVGEWRGDSGAVLRLRPDGGAEATKVPLQPETYDDSSDQVFTRCDGTGTWALRKNDPDRQNERAGVVVRLRGGCGDETYWTIGGTEHDPELFVLFGDPDAGDLRILKRDS
jgi:hypothetical protein